MTTRARLLAAALAIVAVVAVAACTPSGSSSSALVGTWQWTASTEASPPSQAVVPDPENYTITFNADGTFTAKADCNEVAGTYTADGSDLALVLGPSTLMMCPEESLGSLYTSYLDLIASYTVTGDELQTEFIDDSGTMTFTRA